MGRNSGPAIPTPVDEEPPEEFFVPDLWGVSAAAAGRRVPPGGGLAPRPRPGPERLRGRSGSRRGQAPGQRGALPRGRNGGGLSPSGLDSRRAGGGRPINPRPRRFGHRRPPVPSFIGGPP